MQNQNTNHDILEDILLDIETKQDFFIPEVHTEIDPLNFAEISQENPLDNTFVESDDILAELATPVEFFWEEKISQEKSMTQEKSILRKTFDNIFFLWKYVLTSAFIFVVLLGTTNYSAYFEIAKSYINPEALETTRQGMYASIEASSFEKQREERVIAEEISNQQKLEMVKNKNYHSMEKLNHIAADKNIALNIDITPYENRIVIPKIGKNIPLVDVENRTVKNVKELEDVFMKELVNGIVRYPGSAKPGQEWNAFIFGHSSNFPWLEGKYNDVFALLDNVVFGDEIIAYYDQKKYVYKVTQKRVIRPGDTSVLQKVEGKKQISLMTCWPVWTTLNRMIVIWELVEVK